MAASSSVRTRGGAIRTTVIPASRTSTPRWKLAHSAAAALTSHLLFAAVALQIALGIWTLLAAAPVWLSAVHQLGAVALQTAALVHAFALGSPSGALR